MTRGLVATRSRARDVVRRGLVRVGGVVALKPAQPVDAASEIDIASVTAVSDVSRGSEKLRHGLKTFKLEAEGRVALDLGASTGGFTQVLLAHGAPKVFAVDIGTAQLHSKIACDPRVVVMEQTDVRLLDMERIAPPVGAITADLSFISLRKALPVSLTLAAPGCWLIALIKPQFELEPALIGKGGIVRDEDARRLAVASVRDWLNMQAGWRVIGTVPTPLKGGSGNQEFLIGAVFDG